MSGGEPISGGPTNVTALKPEERSLVSSYVRRFGIAGRVLIASDSGPDELVIIVPHESLVGVNADHLMGELQIELHRKVFLTMDLGELGPPTEEL